MSWCEAHQVDYAFGFARNERLQHIIEPQMQQAAALRRKAGRAARVLTQFAYQTTAVGAGRGAWWPKPSRSKVKKIHVMW
jgi:Transposase DDE domain group 1